MSCRSDDSLSQKRIGILGGSFDPIHNGHLAIAESAYKDFGLDEVWFIPAGHSPNKSEEKMTPAPVRLELTELAVKGIPYFKVCDIELHAERTSYTYLTLAELKRQHPGYAFYFIMGADSLDYFEKWRHPEVICEKAKLLVAVRDALDESGIGRKIGQLKKRFSCEIHLLRCKRVDVSSHEIRAMVEKGEDISALVPDAAAAYIREQGLYCTKSR